MHPLMELSCRAERDQMRRARIPRTRSTFKVFTTACVLLCLLLFSRDAMAQSGVPDAPSVDSVVEGNQSLTVSWSAPASTGGSDITAYDLRRIETSATDKADANWTVEEDVWLSGTLEYTVSGLSNGIEYNVQVRAVNANGDGAWSTTATGVPDDHGDTRDAATTLQVGTDVEGAIDTVGDVDYFKFVLTQASNVIIRGSSDETLGGMLYDSDGELIDRGSHSDLPHGRDSFLILERLNPGEYYVRPVIEEERIVVICIKVNGGENCDKTPFLTGGYTLSVTTVPEPGSTRNTARPLTLGTISGGTINPESDTDYFSITLSETTHVIVWAAHKYVPHVVDSEGTYREPIDVDGTLLDSSGNPVTANLREEQLNLPMGFYLRDTLAAGTHYLKVVVSGHRANYDRTGPYVIWAEEDTNYGDFLDDCTGITTSYSDPLFGCQWHLDNTGQGQGTSGEDINVTDVWTGGNTGEGIVVAVVDDGVDPDHEDLNVNKDMSHDYLGEDQLVRPHETHGTQVAGIIAAQSNSLGMRGVAPGATIYSYNFLAEGGTLENAVDALTRNMNSTAVSNNSWAGANAYRYIPRPAFYDLALEAGVTRGYGGKGVFYVFSAGNGAGLWAYSNHDELANHHAVTTVCAVNDRGERSYYSERGSNLWVCAPSNDHRVFEPGRQGIATTSSYSRYTGDFGGTSAAAPQVSGVAALVRKANSNLTWRDVKLILAASARKNDPTNDGWDDNPSSGWHDGALKYGSTSERYSYSHHYGFGVVDAKAAVELAENWTNLSAMKIAKGESGQVSLAIPDTATTGTPSSMTSTIAMDSYVEFVEFVEVNVDFTHDSYRDLEIELVSPSGAVSILSVPRAQYKNFEWEGSFRFGSARHLGEAAAGTWTLRLKDWINGNAGTLKSWNIRIIGHGTLPGVPAMESVTSGGTTLTVSWVAPDNMGSSAITEYELRYIKTGASDKSDSNWTMEDAWTSGDLEYTVSGLESGVSYDIQMRAVSSQGNGRWSDTVQATGSETPPAPVIGTLAADGHRALKVTWSAPVYQGTSEITAYDVRYIASSLRDRPHLGDVIDNAWTSGSLEYRISGISDLREQDVQVRAVNASGDGEWSEARNSVPLRIGPSEPRIASGSPSGGDRTITINWSQPVHSGASSVIAYDIRYIRADGDTTNEGSWTLVDNAWTSGALTHTITGLENWVLYLIEVRAVNSNSDGDWTWTMRATPQGSDPPPASDPEITIGADASSVSESQVMTFTLHRTGAPLESLRVNVGVTETGRMVSSYHTTRTFERGFTTVELPVTLRNDTVDEDDSIVTAEVRSGSGYSVGSQGTANSTAMDDDHVPVTLAWNSNAIVVAEGHGAVTLVAVATTTKDKMPESDSSFEVVATSYDGTASQPDDYGRLSGRATFTQGDFTRVTVGGQQRYQAVKQFPVTIVDDDVDESVETFTATLVYADPSPSHLTGGNSTATVTITDDELVPVTIANVAPYFMDGSTTRRSVPENSREGTAVGEPVAATDADNDTLVYGLTGTDASSFTIDSTSGQLKTSASLDFETDSSYSVTVNVRDSKDSAGAADIAVDATIAVTISVNNKDEAGTVTLPASFSGGVAATASVTDPDGTVSGDSWRWARGNTATGSFSNISGATSATYTPVAADVGKYLRATVTYKDPESTTVNKTASATSNSAVGASNAEPAFDDGAMTTRTLPENSGAGVNVVGGAVTATDHNSGDTLTYSLTGTDAGSFEIDSNGQLKTKTGATHNFNFEASKKSYSVTVNVSDSKDADGVADTVVDDTIAVTINLTNVNEPPTLTGDATPSSFPENSVRSVATYRATDPERSPITWSLSGDDRDDFHISQTGVLTFANIPDFENPADADQDNEYVLTVEARDDGFHFDRLDVTVTVTNSTGKEEPTITTTRDPSPYRENGTGAVHTFRARDPQGRPVSWTVAGTDGHAFEIGSSGALTFRNPPDFENPTDSNRDNRYEISVMVTDDQGLTDKVDVTVTVTNDAEGVEPTISTRRPPSTYRENGTSAIYTLRASDPQRGPITWTLDGTDRGNFNITPDSSGRGLLVFSTPPDFEIPTDSDRQNDYELTVIATDEDGHQDRLSFTITVTDVNEGPEISRVGNAPGSVPENYDPASVLARYTATDPEDPTAQITRWSTSGRDGGDFIMNEQGELRFRHVPDYEGPADSNRDNVYEVTVRASDGRVYGDFTEVITVNDVNEPPEIRSGSKTAFTQNENLTPRLYTYSANDPEKGEIAWLLGGSDARFFAIDEQGQFSFDENSPPNYEIPGDSGGDNVYDVTVQVRDDGFNTRPLPVTVTVRDVNEGPEVTSGQPAFAISENQDLTNAVYAGFDPEGGAVTRWNVGGRDGGDFTITQEGVLTFRNLPDYERPADSNQDNIYELQVRPYDGRYYGSFDVTVTVNDVNEPPEIRSGSKTAFTQKENLTSQVVHLQRHRPGEAATVDLVGWEAPTRASLL